MTTKANCLQQKKKKSKSYKKYSGNNCVKPKKATKNGKYIK